MHAPGLDPAMTAGRLAVFAYGSLVSAPSAALTLERPVEEVVPARLAGWHRRWSLARDNLRSEKTFARADDGTVPPFFLGLSLEPDALGAGPNGVLVEVTEEELDRLDLREIRYDRMDVTGAAGETGFDRVYTYVAKPEHHRPTPPAGALIIATYLEAVETAFRGLGGDQLELYRETTGPPPVEVVEAVLVEDRIPEGNPRAW
jgi:cation transport regulator ChaC